MKSGRIVVLVRFSDGKWELNTTILKALAKSFFLSCTNQGGRRKLTMSFKREGDDSSQLNVLRKRRVADLLASFIPEDEAILLKNGRYACTVCFHRPVFDTLDMLTIHRRGKKHVLSLQKHYGKKKEFENHLQKRQHQDLVRAEEVGQQPHPGPAPLLAQTRRIAHHALLKAAPYNSCSMRNRADGSCLGVVQQESLLAELTPWEPKHANQSEKRGATAIRERSSEHAAEKEMISKHPDTETSSMQSLPGRTAGSSVNQRKHSRKMCKKQQKALQTDPADEAGNTDRLRTMEHCLRLRRYFVN
ncbi:sodium channel modifier 1 isoform X2 [Ambystoma mexicanum]|uniref:sodium channel modifier 1 isoform X2 n=1 Tax=Ambystoma mexicanum TaxID=8296 RepID=UPI0037E843CC